MNNPLIDNPVLIAQGGFFDGQRWVIRDIILIGRGEDCDIVLPSQQVSRYHARLTLTEEGVVFEDLASKNGSYYNGQLITNPILLKEEDNIQICLAQQFSIINADVTLPIQSSTLGMKEEVVKPQKPTLKMDKRSHRVWIGDKEIKPPLSLLQFNLLDILYQNMGQIISRKEIISYVWGDDNNNGVTEQALDALVRRLRERITEVLPDSNYINTIRGHGLILDNYETQTQGTSS